MLLDLWKNLAPVFLADLIMFPLTPCPVDSPEVGDRLI